MSAKIEYNGSTVATVEGGKVATLPVENKQMATNIVVTVPKTDYNDLTNTPVIPSSVNAVEHQYAVSNSKDSVSTVETWNGITSSLSQRERSCIFANGYYVVCGVGGEVGYSKDGVNWTKIAPFYSKTLTNIAYGKGKFIIVDEDDGLWMAEETPISWSKIDVTFSAGIDSLTYANSRFVIAGAYMCAFSEDGIKWTEVEAPGEYNQITFGGGRYVAVGANGSVGVSYDGTTWVDRSNPDVTGDLRGVVYAKGKYIIGGIDGLIMYTEDFVTWGIATSNSAGVRYVRQITYAENKYYATTYTSSGKGEIWTSLDGMTWTVQQQMNVRLWCLAYNDGKLITAGDSGSVFVLDLGIVWQTKQADLADGQYLWERIVFTLSDGGQVVSDGVFIKAYQKTEDWTFTLADGSTVTKEMAVVSTGGGGIKTFTIDGESFEFVEGMSWYQWAGSDYAPDSYTCASTDSRVKPSGDTYIVDRDGEVVLGRELIHAGDAYSIEEDT